MVRLVWLLLALVAAAGDARAATCGDLPAAAEGVQAALRAYPAPEDPAAYPDPILKPEATRAIEAAKVALNDYVDLYMRCTRDTDPAALLGGLALPIRAEQGPDADGVLAIDVRPWVAARPLVGVIAQLPITCGTDSVLTLYEQQANGGWAPVLRAQSPPYDKVSGAQGTFDYRVSPPDQAGNWYVLTKSLAPWCSSAWTIINYSVLRPGAGPVPRVLLSVGESMFGGDDLGTIEAGGDAFDVRFHSHSIDLDVHNRLWVRHFSINGDVVRRIPPLAASARDFAEEWILSDWKAASAWSSGPGVEALHAQMKAIGVYRFAYESIRRCSDRSDHYQIALAAIDGGQHFYLHVVGDSDFHMMEAARIADPACDGPDIKDTMNSR